MASAHRPILLAVSILLLGPLGGGCANSLDVRMDEGADFSAYRTWGWHVPSATDMAELSPEELGLMAAIARQIQTEMASRGYAYRRAGADLRVTPELTIRRRHEVTHQGKAQVFVPSLHASPSYEIEGLSTERVRVVESTALAVVVTDPRDGRVVWRGRMRRVFEGGFASEVGPSVAALMQPFPDVAAPGAPAATRVAQAPMQAPTQAPTQAPMRAPTTVRGEALD